MPPFSEEGARNRGINVILLSRGSETKEALQEALSGSPSKVSATLAGSAEEVLEALPDVGEDQLFPVVPLVLADQTSADKAATEVLEEIKDSSSLRRIPVVMLVRDPAKAGDLYEAYANAIIAWPEDGGQKAERLDTLLEFWSTIPALP